MISEQSSLSVNKLEIGSKRRLTNFHHDGVEFSYPRQKHDVLPTLYGMCISAGYRYSSNCAESICTTTAAKFSHKHAGNDTHMWVGKEG